MLLALSTNNPILNQERTARCPTCDNRTQFSYAGEQHWPLKVAQAVGIDPVVRLWHCGCCHTTVSERELKQ
jgi:hypothetical protein